MGMFFNTHVPGVCALCGAVEKLSGEHKIKASLLRREFGSERMTIRSSDALKMAQSAKSKFFHFQAPLCIDCNGARTQSADKAFEQIHIAASQLLRDGKDPIEAFDEAVGSASYLDCFRYFAKLMCCHLAELEAPRPLDMVRFALGAIDTNRIHLHIDRDWEYQRMEREREGVKYAAHGGLVCYGSQDSGAVTAFHSTLTIGPLRYVFNTRLSAIEQLVLRLAHRPFYEQCRARILDPEQRNHSRETWLKLGVRIPQE